MRLSNDKFRFEKLSLFCKAHKDLVKEEEVVISAGIIGIYPTEFKYIDKGSTSLNIFSSLESDIALLEKLLKEREDLENGNLLDMFKACS